MGRTGNRNGHRHRHSSIDAQLCESGQLWIGGSILSLTICLTVPGRCFSLPKPYCSHRRWLKNITDEVARPIPPASGHHVPSRIHMYILLQECRAEHSKYATISWLQPATGKPRAETSTLILPFLSKREKPYLSRPVHILHTPTCSTQIIV